MESTDFEFTAPGIAVAKEAPSNRCLDFGGEWRGDPGKIRTSDTQFRKLLLYPPELRGLAFPRNNKPILAHKRTLDTEHTEGR